MPPFFAYDRSQPTAPFSVPPGSSPDSVVAVTSYSTLGQAIPSEDPRTAQESLYQQSSYQSQSSSTQMASDGRYMYHHPPPPPEVAAPYGYGPYANAPAPYESPQFNQNPARPPARTVVAPQSHSPPQTQQPYNHPPPPPNYSTPPQSYGHPPYVVPQPQPSQAPWTGENWQQHYNQSFPQQHPPTQESSYGSTSARSEAPANPPAEHRVYQAGPPRPEPQARRGSDRPPRPAEAPSQPSQPQPKARKPKEPEPPGLVVPPPPLLGLDFAKLLESYRLLIDNSNILLNTEPTAPRIASAENVERMLQAAMYGVQALDSAATRAASEVHQTEPERVSEDGEGNAQKARQTEQPPAEGQTCLGCNATSTPEWRRGPMGPRTLCNACGLVYAKLMKKRNRDGGRSRTSGPAKRKAPIHGNVDDSAAASSGDGGSDDEDSYGSQDRRSEGAYHGRE